jgi:predicted metal-dependent enzyme (double-stranded beta helix superfamily)
MKTDRSPGRIDLIRRKVLGAATLAFTQFLIPVAAVADTKPSHLSKRVKMNINQFVHDCIVANEEADAQAAVNEVLARAVSTPEAVLAALGNPERAGLNVLLSSPTLTIFAATWTPQMNLMPHDHLMWANIGIYTGREDNIFWKRTSDGIKAYSADALFVKDTAMLPADVLHSVTNPLQRFTGGIHIYGGDFFNTTRSQWNPETLEQEPSDGARIREMFQRENERLGLDKRV